MSEEGKQFNEFIEEIRNLCKQISDLLGTADKLMAEKGWVASSNAGLFERTANVYDPQKWFPSEIYRLYQNEEVPHILAFITVILFDRYDEYDSLKEPLISAVWFDYGKGENAGTKWEYWYTRFHGYMDERKDDGSLCSVTPKTDWPEDQYGYMFKTANSFALPLLSITDAKELKTKITDPLLEKISGK